MAACCGKRFQERRKTSTLFEGLSRLMGAVIVSTSEHITSAPMASHLVRNSGSRFKFSEGFQHVPIREMTEMLMDEADVTNTDMGVLGHQDGCFPQNQALSCSLRPNDMEGVGFLDHFEQCELKRVNKFNENDEDCHDLDDANHPGHEKQKVKRRAVPALGQFSHWSFADATTFGGSMFRNGLMEVPASVEDCCRSALMLFVPFRKKEDLMEFGSHWKKLSDLKKRNQIPAKITTILPNMQLFHNSTRVPGTDDPLSHLVDPHECKHCDHKMDCSDEDDEEDLDDCFDGVFGLLQNRESQTSEEEKEPHQNSNFSLLQLRKGGHRGCGFKHLPDERDSQTRVGDAHSASIENSSSTFTIEDPDPANSNNEDKTGRKAGKKRKRKQKASRDEMTTQRLMKLACKQRIRRIKGENVNEAETEINADGSAISMLKWSNKGTLNFDRGQKTAFRILAATFVLTHHSEATVESINPEGRCQLRNDWMTEKQKLMRPSRKHSRDKAPLRMFSDGAGGSGKSRVVKESLKCAKSHTKNLKVTFDARTIVVTALSGVAAVSIGGETVHSAASLNGKIDNDDLSWTNARLLIIDEVSFMSVNDMENLDQKLRKLLRKPNSLFGGTDILFCGDFRQLEPCRGTPLCSQRDSDTKWAESINCHLELTGTFRFQEDPEWGRILGRMRKDQLTTQDTMTTNKRAVKNLKRNTPKNTSCCVCHNRDRSAIEAGIFANKLKVKPSDAIVIKASDMQRKNTKTNKLTNMQEEDRNCTFEHCGDDRLKTSAGKQGHFVDPMLKLHTGAPLMLVSNKDVVNGHANGTRVILESVVLKQEARASTMQIEGTNCRTVEAKDVKHLKCSMQTDNNTQQSKHFYIEPSTMTCRVKAPVPSSFGHAKGTINFTMKLTQLPLIINNATTGHKLQGQTKHNLVTSTWSNVKNWSYVALSRAKTRNGLCLMDPLPHNADFSIKVDLQKMMEDLKRHTPEEVRWNLDLEEQHWIQKTEQALKSNTIEDETDGGADNSVPNL